MYLAARGGWLGTDVGRGDGFCEAARSGWLKQPANALSNLGFVVAGLAIGWRAGLPEGRLARPGLATAFAVVVVLLGPGSMAMHATQTAVGGHLDMTSMFLVASFAAAYALMRWEERGSAYFGGVFAGLPGGLRAGRADPRRDPGRGERRQPGLRRPAGPDPRPGGPAAWARRRAGRRALDPVRLRLAHRRVPDLEPVQGRSSRCATRNPCCRGMRSGTCSARSRRTASTATGAAPPLRRSSGRVPPSRACAGRA